VITWKKASTFKKCQSYTQFHCVLCIFISCIWCTQFTNNSTHYYCHTIDCYRSCSNHKSGGERYMEGIGNNIKNVRIEWGLIVPRATSPWLKASWNKMTWIKLVGSQVVSVKQNMNINFQQHSMFVFFVSHNNGLIKSYSSFKGIRIQNFMVLHQPAQVLHPFQMYECPPLWNKWSYRIKMYAFEAILNGTTPTEFHKHLLTASKFIKWDTD
jgi:hypothetical protein